MVHGPLVWAVALAIFAGGVFFVGNALWNLLAGMKSRSWPSTRGTITAAELEEKSDSDGTTYRARVVYEYRTNRGVYSSSRVFFGDWLATNASRAAAARRVKKYPVGSTVTVFHDPARPSRTVLEPGLNGYFWFEIAFGLVVAFGAVFGILNV
jgi:hypothetical protein